MFNELWPVVFPVAAKLTASDFFSRFALNGHSQIGAAGAHAVHDVLQVAPRRAALLRKRITFDGGHGGNKRFEIHGVVLNQMVCYFVNTVRFYFYGVL